MSRLFDGARAAGDVRETLSITEKHLLRGEKVCNNASYVMHRALHSLFMQSLYRIDSVRPCVYSRECARVIREMAPIVEEKRSSS